MLCGSAHLEVRSERGGVQRVTVGLVGDVHVGAPLVQQLLHHLLVAVGAGPASPGTHIQHATLVVLCELVCPDVVFRGETDKKIGVRPA